ncbi:ribose transport system permease protein RbsC [Treponema primitia ZAS-2]|uniref:Ribose transport system permease protein RbsC n=1 Tax=Treponema primitia (strain ATCC BAA-887 / DSM 12427 / ZAS-2) TaxID=545694 RepID=F5YLH9_TREPZ|nr:ABC transporter permease [Treponema primitia]AEF84558.1 ribose transport system permease protein RbsC [Treponema primitia ZAS-2]
MSDSAAKSGLKIQVSRSQKQLLSTFSGLFILGVVFSILSPYFFSVNNLLTVATQTAVIAIIAIGQTYVLITGGIDLSIGSNIALSAMVAGLVMRAQLPVPLAICAGLVTGAISGAVGGILVAIANIPPFIATLGTMTIARGLALTLTQAIPISGLPKSFTVLGTGSTLGIPNPVIVMVLLVVVFGFILAKTKLGRHVYATGSNFEAARLSGVNTKKVLITVYVFSGLLAAFAGLIMAARIISAQPAGGDGYELDAVASSVIGGTSTMGGEGTAAGTFIGAFVIGVLRNGLNLIGVSPFIQKIVIGIVIVASVFLDRMRKKD